MSLTQVGCQVVTVFICCFVYNVIVAHELNQFLFMLSFILII